MGKKPKEDPADKAARLRERRMTELERGVSAQDNAAGATTDIRAIYGSQPKTAVGGQTVRPLAGKTGNNIDSWMRSMLGLK